jgi:Tol biopolymer transport system component
VGNDPRQIYSGGISYRGELSRIDATTGKMEPFMGGIPAGQIAFSADGKLVIFTGFQERTLWKSNRDGSNRIQLTDGDFSFVESPRFSPDGKQILFANALPNGTFKTDAPVKAYILPVDGGRPQRLLPDDQEDQSDPNWSPDGRQIVLAGGDRSRNKSFIRILDLATRRLKMLPGSSGFSSPRWSPDGRYIAALSGEKPFVRIFDLKEERWSTISAEGNIRYPVFSANGRYLYYLSYRSTPLNLQIYRARVVEGKPKRIVDLAGWPLVTVWGLTMSLDTSDNPIVTRDTGTCDIYSLQLDIK